MTNQSSKKATSSRIQIPLPDVERHLEEQLQFLRKSAADFDAGDTAEFRRLALALRILLHHKPPNSHSVLEQAGLSRIPFVSYALPINKKNLLAEFRLAIARLSDKDARLEPLLDRGPFPPQWIAFDSWISEPVLRDDRREQFSRSDLIRLVADQDGGAHVDPKIDEKYHRLINDGSIGLIHIGPDGERPVEHIEKVYVRHIAWEALLSIETTWKRVIGNRLCGCGTGRKRRYCCGKQSK